MARLDSVVTFDALNFPPKNPMFVFCLSSVLGTLLLTSKKFLLQLKKSSS